ncbi:hypothetical protein OSTOST_08615 [Ostertagia ostertagi]
MSIPTDAEVFANTAKKGWRRGAQFALPIRVKLGDGPEVDSLVAPANGQGTQLGLRLALVAPWWTTKSSISWRSFESTFYWSQLLNKANKEEKEKQEMELRYLNDVADQMEIATVKLQEETARLDAEYERLCSQSGQEIRGLAPDQRTEDQGSDGGPEPFAENAP